MTHEEADHSSSFPSTSVPSRLAAVTTGCAVIIVCVGYMAWSLTGDRPEAGDPPEQGVTLVSGDDANICLNTPLSPPPIGDETPLELDDSFGSEELPVINAHLELPTVSEPMQLSDLPETSVRRLSHERSSQPAADHADAGVWLTGTIEAHSAGNIEIRGHEGGISRYIR